MSRAEEFFTSKETARNHVQPISELKEPHLTRRGSKNETQYRLDLQYEMQQRSRLGGQAGWQSATKRSKKYKRPLQRRYRTWDAGHN